MIPGRIPLRDLLPDPNHPRVPDVQDRHFFQRTFVTLRHPNPVGGDSISTSATETQRIRSVRASADPSGDTAEFSILVEGRTVVAQVDSGGATVYPGSRYLFPAGSTITSDFIGAIGAPTGPVSVVIEMDSFVVAPRTEVEPRGRDRLFLDRRREAERVNQTIAERRPNASLERAESTVGYRVREREPNIRNPNPIKRIDHRFRPRRPR